MLAKEQNNKLIKQFLLSINNEIFKDSLLIYLLFILLEAIKRGFVSNFFNLNIILLICVVSGVINVCIARKKEKDKEAINIKQKNNKRHYLIIILFGLGGFFITFNEFKEMGKFAYILAASVGFLVIFISFIMWEEDSV